MPVIVDRDDYALWINPELEDPDRLAAVIDRNLGAALDFFPVSTYVNDVRRDDPRCLEAIANSPGLF
jgi:putative SOS response-associated peptidase YedK